MNEVIKATRAHWTSILVAAIRAAGSSLPKEEQIVIASAELKSVVDRVRGNRDKKSRADIHDIRLIFVGILKRAVEIIEEAETKIFK